MPRSFGGDGSDLPGSGILRTTRLAAAAGLALFPAVTSAESSSPLTPASPNAIAIANLFWIIIAIAAVIFIGVEGVLFYSVIAYRDRPGRRASQFAGNVRLELIWTAIPALILAGTLYLTVRTLIQTLPPLGDPLDVRVVAHQWWWEIDYPNEGIRTANELHVPVGETVIVRLESNDVIHSFWVPSLAPKMDAIPGRTQIVWFQPLAADVYLGRCAEFCGVQHAWMEFRVYAQSFADYLAWVKSQQQPAATPSGLAAEGQQIYFSQTCGACHTISGTASNGISAPNLTHVASRWTIGAGVLANTPDNMQLWLENPQAVKPGTAMPNYHFTPDQARALAAYMESLR
jgi:cytochrome c oxidase subunit 2